MDANDIWASRLWRDLDGVRQTAGAEEVPFSEVVFVLLAMQQVWTGAYAAPRVSKALQDDIAAMFSVNKDSSQCMDLALRCQRALFSELGIPHYNDDRPLITASSFLVPVLRTLHSYLESSVIGDWRRLIDIVFTRTLPRSSLSNQRASRAGVELALNFVPHTVQLIDHFMASGEFAVRAAARTQSRVRVTSGVSIRGNPSLLHLRLMLAGVEIDRGGPEQQLAGPRLALISHPDHKAARGRSYAPRLRSDEDGRIPIPNPAIHNTAIEGLSLLTQEWHFSLAIVAVPAAENTAGGWRAELRQQLVRRGQLAAVIDGAAIRKGDKEVAYWLVSRDSLRSNGVLFIHLASLAREQDADTADLMAFAASIVCRLHPALDDGILSQRGTDRYHGLFSRYFEAGYQDIDGLCRVVPAWDLEAKRWSLNAVDYLAPEMKVQRRLDGHHIMELLLKSRAPVCAYVIGNNGQGKSMLLAQLADELAEQHIRTAGIAFGLTDRFAFNARIQSGDRFAYLGARTAEGAVSLASTRRRMHACVRAIAESEERLEAFREALLTLGFGQRLYLIPEGVTTREGVIAEERLADILELTRIRGPAPSLPTRFSLAVLAPDNRVVPFDKLSSGEQQLITLAAKLSANAERDWVMLIDEPELSLHVSWQRSLPAMLAALSRQLGCSLVVATHSPVLIASTGTNDYCYSAERQTLTPLSRSTLASVESVLFEEFETYTVNNRRVHELCARTVASVMRHLNGEDLGEIGRFQQDALSELSKVARVVQKGSDARGEGERDLELVRRTRAAVEELFAQEFVRSPSIEEERE